GPEQGSGGSETPGDTDGVHRAGLEADYGTLDFLRDRDGLLGRLRASGVDDEPVCGSVYAPQRRQLRDSLLVASERAVGLRHHPRSRVCVDVDSPWPTRSIGSDEDRPWGDVHGYWISGDGTGRRVRAKRGGSPGQPPVAGAVLLPLRARRALPVPRRAERRDEALSATYRRRDDGRLVSVYPVRPQ